MNTTPQGNRTHIGIFGETNAGKSSLFNAITNTDISIISDVEGTTTDPVKKAMELLPFGPIMLIDTAGINDTSKLGNERVGKTLEVLSKIDYALYVADVSNFNKTHYENTIAKFDKYKISHALIFTKCDLNANLKQLQKKYNDAFFINTNDEKHIEKIKNFLCDELGKKIGKEKLLIADLIPKYSQLILVAPQDSEAPKGRLILPQAQLIRECLDNDILCSVCTLETLQKTIESLKKVDLVVTDSQVFKEVDKILPSYIKLTSFSILYANQKGEIDHLKKGLDVIRNLKENDKILMAEVCTHNVSHEDIGRYKIPKMLKAKTNKNLNFEYVTGKDFDINLSKHSLIIHCGGCMITRKDMTNRIQLSYEKDIPITNYGMLIAYCTGILERSLEIIN